MALSLEATRLSKARLLVASAGLGLVDGNSAIPPYGATVGMRNDDSVGDKVDGRFDPAAWWRSVANGPYSEHPGGILRAARRGLVMVVLSRPYAAMFAQELERMTAAELVGLRIFGWRLEDVLADRMRPNILPYDARLDSLMPGTRCDFPQRALLHFVKTVGVGGTLEVHRSRVLDTLEGTIAPQRPKRPQVDDDEVISWLRKQDGQAGIGAALRAIRTDGIACEQKRFSRLYRSVMGRMAA